MNPQREYFMDKYSPLKDLAPRIEVSRSIYEEMIQEQRRLRTARPGFLCPDQRARKISDNLQHLLEIWHQHRGKADTGGAGSPL